MLGLKLNHVSKRGPGWVNILEYSWHVLLMNPDYTFYIYTLLPNVNAF